MSVIVWDGKTLAADKQDTYGGTAVPVTKIFRVGNELVGAVGKTQECVAFIEWVRSGRPDPKPSLSENFCGYIVNNGHLWRYEDMLVGVMMDVPFWAGGCGADYAMGAMAMGAAAQRAVEVACQLDVQCGLGCDTLQEVDSEQ